MVIPDHVKKAAMDAVSHHETTEFMRLHGFSSEGVSAFQPSDPKSHGVINEAVKRQAVDAVSHRETTAQIRLVEDTGAVFPAATPSRKATHGAQLVNDLHRSGAEIDAVQRQVTQDGFGRFYG